MAQRFLSAPKKASRRQRGFAARREGGVAAHRQHGVAARRERGFAAIVGIIIVVIIGLMAATLGYLSSNNAASGAGLNQSGEAFFIAKSGIEYAGFNLGSGTACGSLSTAAQTVGGGTFTLSAGTLYNTSTTVGTGGISSSDTIIPVGSVANLASHGLVSVASSATSSEDIQYGSTSTSATTCSPKNAPCLLGARRGYSGSTAAAAAAAVTVSQLQCVVRSTGVASGSPGATRVLEASFQIVNPAVANPQAMIVYTKGSSTQAYSRVWDPTTGGWASETTAPVAGTGGGTATNLQFLRLALARTRNDAVLVLKDTSGQIFVQTWNGTTWTTQNSNTRISNTGSGGSPDPAITRGFDVVYQTSNDNAMIVYDVGGTNAAPRYRTWDGTTLSGAGNTNLDNGSGSSAPNYGINIPLWIELAANPLSSSNEVALIAMQSSTSSGTGRRAVRGNVWNGSWPATGSSLNGGNTLGYVNAATFTVPTDTNVRKAIAVSYESQSGRAMYAWADSAVAGQIDYVIYAGTTLKVSPASTILTTTTCIGEWLRLISAPNSNNIMLALQSAKQASNCTNGPRLDTLLWDGSSWSGAHPQHAQDGLSGRPPTTASEFEQNFEFTFETHPASPGYGWLSWGTGSGVSRRRFESGTTWSNTVSVSVAAGSPTVSFAAVRANPISGRLFDGLYSLSSSAVPGVWTNTRTGAIRDAFNTDDVKGWFAPPVSGSAFSGRLTATTSAASPAGERVAVAVRPAGAALIEMQEIYP